MTVSLGFVCLLFLQVEAFSNVSPANNTANETNMKMKITSAKSKCSALHDQTPTRSSGQVTAENAKPRPILARTNLLARGLLAILAGGLFVAAQSASAALTFGRGTPTAVGPARFSSTPDSVIITGALTGPGTISSGLAIPANRIQYDVINGDVGPLFRWTIYYGAAVGPSIIGAGTPNGFLTSSGAIVPQGGVAYTTLFNLGYGVYNYNTGAPWVIDYQPDHITFIAANTNSAGLPMNYGVGYLNPTPYLPSFDIVYDPNLAYGLVPADAREGSLTYNGQVYGPLPGNGCLTIHATNMTVQTCEPCVPVNFSATATDTCCTNVVLHYSPQPGTCLPLGANTIQVVAQDVCGNIATNYFTVTVNPGPNCQPTNCIQLTTSNITVYTCNPCTTVKYNVTATDPCCASPVTLLYNPPETTCFPQGSVTPVQVVGIDQCNHAVTNSFTVTVLPGPNCGNTNCIQIYQTNIVALTCSNCTTVPFNTLVFDQCCTNVSLLYNPPTNTCFGVNTTTPVQILAFDPCGNKVTNYITVTVLPDPNCEPTNCISIRATNITVYTCSNCVTVPFSATAVDRCCPLAPPTITYSLPATYCFPKGSITPVEVVAYDQCGNRATNTFTVTVLPDPHCGNTNCISIRATNIVVQTCNPCTPVPFNAIAIDTCCPGSSPTVVYDVPAGFCFPVNTITTVNVTAFDQCGNSATKSFTVTVVPGPNCPPTPGFTVTNNPTGGMVVTWPVTNAQLLESSDLIRWSPVPGANSPYVVPTGANGKPMKFYRLQYLY